jgi:hypothetical protein
VLFTDGISESMPTIRSGEKDEIVASAKRCRGPSATDIRDAVLAGAKAFAQGPNTMT